MRRAQVYMTGHLAGWLTEHGPSRFLFRYRKGYSGPPVSLSMPISRRDHPFDRFPPFFEGLLPEGEMLEGLLRQRKLDRDDMFGQLLAVGEETVGAVTVVTDSG